MCRHWGIFLCLRLYTGFQFEHCRPTLEVSMPDVQHLPDQQRFIVSTHGDEAVMTYRLFTNNGQAAIDFNSTYVPPAYRGKGLAEKLVRAGLTWAKAQGYELHASCWYVAKFIR